jgi:hypothetical protein
VSLYRWWRRAVTGRVLLPAAVVLVAASVAVALVPRGISAADAAPNDGGITWTPDGTPAQSSSDGECEVAMSGTVAGPAQAVAQVDSALDDEKPDTVSQDGIGALSVSAPASSSGTSMTVFANADADVDCSAASQATAYIHKLGYASPAQFAQAVLARGPRHASLTAYSLATWLKVALAAVAGAVVFAAVSVAVTAALAALLASETINLTIAAIALISGCIAGLAAGPVATAIATSGNLTVASGLASAVAGCFAGTVVTAAAGLQWIAATFQALGWDTGSATIAVIGQRIADAAAAGTSLTSVQTTIGAIASIAAGG